MKYYIGVDIGGTNIKAGVVDENAQLVSKISLKTNAADGYKSVLAVIIDAVEQAVQLSGEDIDRIKTIGVGCPGTMDNENGTVLYSNNLHWENVPLAKDLEEHFGKRIILENDANVAAYGEYLAGAAKGAKNAVVLTLGTGVGAGIIINGEIYSGSNNAGGEIGHTVIEVDGAPCTCGRNGCFEAYSSATGLVRMTREMIEKYPNGWLHEMVDRDGKISARTAFNAAKLGDPEGREVVDKYIKYLACGITNVINVFQPDILCIGGGVCNEGDNLLIPLKALIAKQIYSKNNAKNTEIVICTLANEAGMIGSAMLVVQTLRRHKAVGYFQVAFGGDFNQLFGNVADFLLNLGLFGLPCQPAQRIELNVVVFHTVARNDVDILNRHEQFGIAGIQNFQAIVRRAACGNVLQPQKPADTVFDVHNQFADRQGRNIGNKVFGSNFFGTFAVLPLAENILLRN